MAHRFFKAGPAKKFRKERVILIILVIKLADQLPLSMKNIDSDSTVVLIGAGIMSATLGTLIKELAPGCKLKIFERLDRVAAESSDPWNNAGTGHSALCELNYTPQLPDGSIDTSKALHVIEQFEATKQFWTYLVEQEKLVNPRTFIRSVPHMSFVHGN